MITPTPSSPKLTKHDIIVLLVDDQLIIGEAVRRMLSGESDIVFHFCSDPAQAQQKAEELKPTLILQDLVLPQIDGLTLVKNYRANPATKDIPLIVLSTKEEPKTKAEAFSLGANDYLVKLPDKIELIARIRYHSTAYINLLQRNEAYQALVESQQALAAELAEAADYVRDLLPAALTGEISTSWKFITSTSLGGDAFGYHWIDDEHFAIYLLDVCGHGVGAALLSVSALNVISAHTLPDVDFRKPADVITALNHTFPMEKQHNMYFTIWYGVYHKTTRKLTYSSAGHPPAILVKTGADGQPETVALRAPAMPVGALSISKFQSLETDVPANAKLFVFSDGTYEIKRPDGTMMELEEFVHLLAKPVEGLDQKLDAILSEVRSQQGSEFFVDDFSIVEFQLA
ncbi:MAG: response regulator [Verrucomicrobia bacterium Tous-C9LFEB]|nr:MAG: response regulator [Verrucomicrobia bacterium Tous-C9LFEB]